jgi:probable F420-dependent oxidoreductase
MEAPMRHPRLTLGLPNFGEFLRADDWRRLLDIAEAAEDAGVDALSVVDHVVLGGDLDRYPYGSFPGGPDAPWLEPLTTLSAIAGRTSRIRLATGILIAPLRPAALLAKTAATLDVISGGRLDLGVGTGWLAKEYEALGLDFAERGRLLDQTLAACEALWRGGPTAFASPRLSFADVYCHPVPAQPGGIPLWLSGKANHRNVERVARFGSGWIPSPTARPDEIAAGVERLHTALKESGRDPASLRVRVGLRPRRDLSGDLDLDLSLAALPELVRSGGTDVLVLLPAFCPDAALTDQFLRRLVPAFRSATA